MKKKGLKTISIHDGELVDNEFKGAISPLYMSTVYDYMGDNQMPYPRYFNTPNQINLSKKIASLENCEKGLLFGSGIAAIFASMFTFLKSGDHVVLQSSLYGGTINLVQKEFDKFKIDYSLVESLDLDDFEKLIKNNISYTVSANLKNAVNSIYKDINYNNISGSTILLSPAAASFDQFRNFEDRGVYFKKLIKQKFKKN